MTRIIPRSLAILVELLELERPAVVTVSTLGVLAKQAGLRGEPRRLASRLAALGWLLPTGVHGAWEFVPGERAGALSANDPWLVLRGVLARSPSLPARVTLGSALFLMDLTDRGPDRQEVAVPTGIRGGSELARAYRTLRFNTVLKPVVLRGLPVEAPATLLVHLAATPGDVRSWESVLAALPGLVERVTPEALRQELAPRTPATRARVGYLVEPYAPTLVAGLTPAPGGLTWFGPRRPVRRRSTRWQVADTLLPRAPGSEATA